jgi:DNA primase
MKSAEVNFAAVRQAASMEAVLKRCQVTDLRGGAAGRYRGRCPLHRGEGRDAFHVDVRRKIFHCFSCGAGGDVLDLVAQLHRCTLREAALRLQQWFPAAATNPAPPRQRVTKGKKVSNAPLPFTLRGVDGAHEYLRARAIGERTAARFGVGFYRGPGLMRGRVVIPIHDEGGRLVAYAGRSVDGAEPRYRFPTGFCKSQVLFNFHRARAMGGDTVVAVEGFFDCLRVSQAGVENVVALLGTELYPHPAQLLGDRFRRVLLMLDGDEAGQQAQARVVARLRDRCEVRVMGLPAGMQPDQLPERRLREWIAGAGGCGRRSVEVLRRMTATEVV